MGTQHVLSPDVVQRLVNVIGFLDLFAVSMVVPLISRHVRELGVSPVQIGLVGSIYGCMQLFTSPIVGRWSDRCDRRYVLLWCLFFTAASYFLMGLGASLPLIIAARFIAGCFKYSQDISRNCLSDRILPPRRSAALGRFNSASSIGFTVGPLVGGYLCSFRGGFHWTACLSAFCFVVCWVLVWYFVPPATQEENEQKARTKTPQSNIVSDFKSLDWKNFWDIFMVRFLIGFAVMVYRSSFSMILDIRFDVTPLHMGYLTSLSSMTSTVSSYFVGRVSECYKDEEVLLRHMGYVQFLSLTGLALAPNVYVIALFLIPLAIANAVARVASTTVTINRGGTGNSGALLGLGASVLSIARMTSPLAGGLAQEFHILGPGLLSAASALFGATIMTLHRPPKPKTQ